MQIKGVKAVRITIELQYPPNIPCIPREVQNKKVPKQELRHLGVQRYNGLPTKIISHTIYIAHFLFS